MGKESDVLTDYLKNPRRFADLFNGGCFDGKAVVQPECLEDGSETYVEKNKTGTVPRARDIRKKLRTGQNLKVLAIENENQVDYTMPWRTMNYDALDYGAQIKEIRNQNKENGLFTTDGEFISGLRKDDRLSPTYTICLYHGEDAWDGPRSLKDMMDFGQDRELWEPFFSDYKMKLICLNEPGDFSQYKSPLKELFQLLSIRKDRKRVRQILNENPAYREMDYETAEVVGVMMGMENAIKQNTSEGGTVNMCTALKEIVEESKTEGRIEGLTAGRIEGTALSIISLLQLVAPVSNELQEYILAQDDVSILQNWLLLAARTKSVEQFQKDVCYNG